MIRIEKQKGVFEGTLGELLDICGDDKAFVGSISTGLRTGRDSLYLVMYDGIVDAETLQPCVNPDTRIIVRRFVGVSIKDLPDERGVRRVEIPRASARKGLAPGEYTLRQLLDREPRPLAFVGKCGNGPRGGVYLVGCDSICLADAPGDVWDCSICPVTVDYEADIDMRVARI